MKKRLLVLGGLIIVIVVLFVVLPRTGVVGRKMTTCESFLAAVQAGDAEKSYAMFTEQAQDTLKYNEWQKQVPQYKTAYGQKKPELASDKNSTSLNSNAESLTESYTMTNYDNKYTATCYLRLVDGAYQVGGFVSEVKY